MTTDYIVITCGGTGGHFYPGLSVAREQLSRGKKVLLLLSGKNSVEQSRVAEKFNVPCQVLPYMPSPSIKHPGSCWRFIKGLITGWRIAKKVLKAEQPQAVLGMGSFASLPVILAAKSLKIAIFLHDGNARIGKANRTLSRYARVLATAFPAVNRQTVRCKYVVSGMPIRPELKQTSLSKESAIEALNNKFKSTLSGDYFTVLLFGGSQGARKLNEVFGQAVKDMAAQGKKIQLIQLTGAGEFEAMAKFYGEPEFPLLLLPKLEEMHWAFNAADLVISRSGGSTVAELNAFGKYSVVIPYPFAAELHQDDNADYLASLGAAEKVNNKDLNGDVALEILSRLSSRNDLSVAGADSILPGAWDGAENVLKIIDENCGDKAQ